MIIKSFRKEGFGFFGQNAESWTRSWNEVKKIALSAKNAEKDHLSPFFKKYFRFPPEKILEGGCGTGKYVIVYRHMGYDIIGVDFSGDTIRRIKQEMGEDFPVYEANILSLPFDNGYFDCYFSGGVIEHFEEGPDKPLKEARRVIRKGGILLATVPYINLLRKLCFLFFSKKENSCYFQKKVKKCQNETGISKEYKFFEYIFDINSLSPYFKSSGFVIEETHPTDLLWGEIGLLPRKIIASLHRLKSKTTNIDPEKSGLIRDKNHILSFIKNIVYDFLITENRDNILFKFPIAFLNYLSGHMVLFVARAI